MKTCDDKATFITVPCGHCGGTGTRLAKAPPPQAPRLELFCATCGVRLGPGKLRYCSSECGQFRDRDAVARFRDLITQEGFLRRPRWTSSESRYIRAECLRCGQEETISIRVPLRDIARHREVCGVPIVDDPPPKPRLAPCGCTEEAFRPEALGTSRGTGKVRFHTYRCATCGKTFSPGKPSEPKP